MKVKDEKKLIQIGFIKKYFPNGLGAYQHQIECLRRRQYTSLNFERIDENYPIFSIRYSQKARLILAIITIDHQKRLLLIRDLDDHNYNKVKKFNFEKIFEDYHRFIRINQSDLIENYHPTSIEEAFDFLQEGTHEALAFQYHDEQMIILSETQNDLQYKMNVLKHCVVLAPMGYGKTVTIEGLIQNNLEQDRPQDFIILVPTLKLQDYILKNSMPKDEEGRQKYEKFIRIETIDAFFKQKKSVKQEDFVKWCEHLFLTETGKKTYGALVNIAKDALYQESKIIGGYYPRNKEIYLQVQSSWISKNDNARASMWDLYDVYFKSCKHLEVFDPAIHKVVLAPIGDNTRIIVDEGHNLLPSQIISLLGISCSVHLFLDTNQQLQFLPGVMSFLKLHFQILKYDESHRASRSVAALLNLLFWFRRVYTGGISHDDEIIDIHATKKDNEGIVELIESSSKSNPRIFALKNKLAQTASSGVIITDESEMTEVENILGQSVQIYTVAQAQGLQFKDCVVVYDPFQRNKKNTTSTKKNLANGLRFLNQQIEQGITKTFQNKSKNRGHHVLENTALTDTLNHFSISISRACPSAAVFIIQPNAPEHILKHMKQTISSFASTIENRNQEELTDSPLKFMERVDELIKEGLLSQARKLYDMHNPEKERSFDVYQKNQVEKVETKQEEKQSEKNKVPHSGTQSITSVNDNQSKSSQHSNKPTTESDTPQKRTHATKKPQSIESSIQLPIKAMKEVFESIIKNPHLVLKKLLQDQKYQNQIKSIDFFDQQYCDLGYKGCRSLFEQLVESDVSEKNKGMHCKILLWVIQNTEWIEKNNENVLFFVSYDIKFFKQLSKIKTKHRPCISLFEKLSFKDIEYQNLILEIIRKKPTLCRGFYKDLLWVRKGKECLIDKLLRTDTGFQIIQHLIYEDPDFLSKLSEKEFFYQTPHQKLSTSIFFLFVAVISESKNFHKVLCDALCYENRRFLEAIPSSVLFNKHSSFEGTLFDKMIKGSGSAHEFLYQVFLTNPGLLLSTEMLSKFSDPKYNLSNMLNKLNTTDSGKRLIFFIALMPQLLEKIHKLDAYQQFIKDNFSDSSMLESWISKIVTHYDIAPLEQGLSIMPTIKLSDVFMQLMMAIVNDKISFKSLGQVTPYLEVIQTLSFRPNQKRQDTNLLFCLLHIDAVKQEMMRQPPLGFLKSSRELGDEQYSLSLFGKYMYILTPTFFGFSDVERNEVKIIATASGLGSKKWNALHLKLSQLDDTADLPQKHINTIKELTGHQVMNPSRCLIVKAIAKIYSHLKSETCFTRSRPERMSLFESLLRLSDIWLVEALQEADNPALIGAITKDILIQDDKKMDESLLWRLVGNPQFHFYLQKIFSANKKLCESFTNLDITRLIKMQTTQSTNILSWLMGTDEGVQAFQCLMQGNENILKNLDSGFLHPRLLPLPHHILFSLAKNESKQQVFSAIAKRNPNLFKFIRPTDFYKEDREGHSVFSFLCQPECVATLNTILMHQQELIVHFSMRYLFNMMQEKDEYVVTRRAGLHGLLQTKDGCNILFLLYSKRKHSTEEMRLYQILKEPLMCLLMITQPGLELVDKIKNQGIQNRNGLGLFNTGISNRKEEPEENENQCVIF